MRTVILAPRRSGLADRDKLWAFCKKHWQTNHPDWDVYEGHHWDGPFNRAKAINDAADAADRVAPWDVAVIIDCDSLVDPHQARHMVEMAIDTNALVIYSRERWMLNRQGSQRIVMGAASDWDRFVRIRYGTPDDPTGPQVSACIAVSKNLWQRVGGFDEVIRGYGWEDRVFRWACETISGQDALFAGPKPVWHLHHEPDPTNQPDSHLKRANEARHDRYRDLKGQFNATMELIKEARAVRAEGLEHPYPKIPKIFHRTVPENYDPECDVWWLKLQELHPGWEFWNHQDPLDPEQWETSEYWDACQNGAQKAGLIRLEVLWRYGGIYVDSDVEPLRSFEPLRCNRAFAGWEDETTIPDAVLGAVPGHDLFKLMLDEACLLVKNGQNAWYSGPGVTTRFMNSNVDDCLVLPPGAFYPYHYLQKREENIDKDGPWVFCRHHYRGSWLTEEQLSKHGVR